MMLAAVLGIHEDELRADMQEHYGIDLDHAMSGAHSAYHVAALVSQLPQGSRLRCTEDEDDMWRLDSMLLAGVLNSVNRLAYMLADKKTRGPMPEAVGPSWLRDRNRRSLPARVMTVDRLMDELSKPRGGSLAK